MKSVINRITTSAGAVSGPRLHALIVSSVIATIAIVASALGHNPSTALSAQALQLLSGGSSEPTASSTDPAASSSDGPIASASSPSPSASPGSSVTPSATPTTPTPVTDPTPTDTGDPEEPVDPEDPEETDEETPDDGVDPASGRVKHIFVINLASPGYEDAFGEDSHMPYLAEKLRPEGSLLSKFSLVDKEPLPNGIATIAGQRPNELTREGCASFKEFPAGTVPDKYGLVSGKGCVYPVQTLTIGDQMTSAGLLWRGYAEDQKDQFGAGTCVHPDPNDPEKPKPGEYDPRWNPFVFFHSLLDLGDCASNDVPLAELKGDLKKEDTTPYYSYIAPTPCSGGVIGQCPGAEGGDSEEADPELAAAASADDFLKEWVPLIRSSSAFKKDGLLIITFGQAQPEKGEKDPLLTGSLLLSKYSLEGSDDGTEYTPYSLQRSIAEILGLPPLAQGSAADVESFAAPVLGLTGTGGD